MRLSFRNWNIRTKILSGFLCVILLIGVLGVISFTSLTNVVDKQIPLIEKNNSLSQLVLELRKNEKDFLLREQANPEFFTTGESKYLATFDSKLNIVMSTIDEIKADGLVSGDMEMVEDLDQLAYWAQSYSDDFYQVVENIKVRGFKEYGLEGELRNAVHDVEVYLEQLPNNESLTILLLEGRRAEKDYFLRKDLSYHEKLTGIVSEFNATVDASGYNQEQKAYIKSLMNTYLLKFGQIVEINQTIGVEPTEGLMGAYREKVYQMEPLLEELHMDIGLIVNHDARNARTMIIGVIIAIILLSLISALVIARLITKPIRNMVDVSKQLAVGDLNTEISVDSEDEIGMLATSFNSMIDNMKEQAEAIQGISEGNLTFDLKPKSENDVVNISLNVVKENIENLIQKADDVTTEFEYGNLNAQMEVGGFDGCWRNLLDNVNQIGSVLEGYIRKVPAVMMAVDRELNVLYMNDAGLGAVGMNREQAKGSKCYDLFKADDCGTDRCACAAAIRTGQNAKSETSAKPQGVQIDIAYEGIPIKDRNGNVIGAVELVVDQTEIMQATRIQKKQAEFQDREVKKLISNFDRLAGGDLSVKAEVATHDEDTSDIAEDFMTINDSMHRMTDSINGYIVDVNQILNKVKDGNLTTMIEREFNGDFTEIKSAVNMIIDSLNSIITDIRQASEQVATGSEELSKSSQVLSNGAMEQAGAIEEITSTLKGIEEQAGENVTLAEQVRSLTVNASSEAEQGNEKMSEMLIAMEEINHSSSDISKIIKVIDEIAFQTNILALNAAVEAARAGEHGKGFAIVADEVRNLATRSANAAKETSVLIEASITRVESGSQIATDTAESLKMIVEKIMETEGLANHIAKFSSEQKTAISQINEAVQQIGNITQTNAATAEESAAASQEMASQSEVLKDQIGHFKIRSAMDMVRRESFEKQFSPAFDQTFKPSYQPSKDQGKGPTSETDMDFMNADFGKY